MSDENIFYSVSEFIPSCFSCHFSETDLIVSNCIESLIEIAKLLYKNVEALEQTPLPTNINGIYQPLEAIDDCPYFLKDSSHFAADDLKVSSIPAPDFFYN